MTRKQKFRYGITFTVLCTVVGLTVLIMYVYNGAASDIRINLSTPQSTVSTYFDLLKSGNFLETRKFLTKSFHNYLKLNTPSPNRLSNLMMEDRYRGYKLSIIESLALSENTNWLHCELLSPRQTTNPEKVWFLLKREKNGWFVDDIVSIRIDDPRHCVETYLTLLRRQRPQALFLCMDSTLKLRFAKAVLENQPIMNRIMADGITYSRKIESLEQAQDKASAVILVNPGAKKVKLHLIKINSLWIINKIETGGDNDFTF